LSIYCNGKFFKTVYLLSEMHLCVYNGQYVTHDIRLLFLGNDRSISGMQADGKKVRLYSHWAKTLSKVNQSNLTLTTKIK